MPMGGLWINRRKVMSGAAARTGRLREKWKISNFIEKRGEVIENIESQRQERKWNNNERYWIDGI